MSKLTYIETLTGQPLLYCGNMPRQIYACHGDQQLLVRVSFETMLSGWMTGMDFKVVNKRLKICRFHYNNYGVESIYFAVPNKMRVNFTYHIMYYRLHSKRTENLRSVGKFIPSSCARTNISALFVCRKIASERFAQCRTRTWALYIHFSHKIIGLAFIRMMGFN